MRKIFLYEKIWAERENANISGKHRHQKDYFSIFPHAMRWLQFATKIVPSELDNNTSFEFFLNMHTWTWT